MKTRAILSALLAGILMLGSFGTALAATVYGCPPEDGGGEGLTPGYWKNHLDDWPPTGFSPNDSFFGVFSEAEGAAAWPEPGDITLDEAVNMKGNSVNSLIRHAVAAILNAAHPDVDYNLTVGEVVALVNNAFATAGGGKKDPVIASAKNTL